MQSIEFIIQGEHIELNKLLKLTGLADGGGAGKAMVAAGGVRVDGATELRKTCKLRPGQLVHIGDVEIVLIAGPAAATP